jgi:uncharacterized protein YndB with AHSA1/START domain
MTNANDATFYVNRSKLLVRRTYNAPAERVFKAWVDPEDMRKWYTPKGHWNVDVRSMDLRIGGGYQVFFGPEGETPYVEAGGYEEITPPYRLVFLAELSRDGGLIGVTRCDISFFDLGDQTEVTMIETGGDPAHAEERAEGWSGTMDNLYKIID